MSNLELITQKGHERVAFFQDARSGLLAIVAVHDTTLGPSLGGCRMRPYRSLEDALFDVLRLSEAMTYKNSLAGLDLGGGKSVIVSDSSIRGEAREKLFLAFGERVRSMEGSYITAEDMGTSVGDMSTILKTCDYVAGRDPKTGGGGDPSPYTALGVFGGIRACLEREFGGSVNFEQYHIAIQGVGSVGRNLAKLLAEAGARLTISDTKAEALREVSAELGATVVSPEEIASVECDVFAPCAVGGVINETSVGQLRCRIVAGAANNQILGDKTEQLLAQRGIMYAPDFAINAGGVINCAAELIPGGYSKSWVMEKVELIYGTVGRIIDESQRTGEASGDVAVRLAKERIAAHRDKVASSA